MLTGAALDEALMSPRTSSTSSPRSRPGTPGRWPRSRPPHASEPGCRDAEVVRARRAGLVHDLGRTAVPNSIWDKPAALTRAEFDRVQLHPLLTEQMLRRAQRA